MVLTCVHISECRDILFECLQKNEGWDILLLLRCCSWQLHHVINVECINQYLYLDPLPFPVCERLQGIPLCEVWKQGILLHNDTENFKQRYESLVRSIASIIHQIANPLVPVLTTDVHHIVINVGEGAIDRVYAQLSQDQRFVGISVKKTQCNPPDIQLELKNTFRLSNRPIHTIWRYNVRAPVEVNF